MIGRSAQVRSSVSTRVSRAFLGLLVESREIEKKTKSGILHPRPGKSSRGFVRPPLDERGRNHAGKRSMIELEEIEKKRSKGCEVVARVIGV